MKTFEELRTILEVNFKADHKKFHIATAKIKNTEIKNDNDILEYLTFEDENGNKRIDAFLFSNV